MELVPCRMRDRSDKFKWNHGTRSTACVFFWMAMMSVPGILEESGMRGCMFGIGGLALYAFSACMMLWIGSNTRHWEAIDDCSERIVRDPSDVDTHLRRAAEYEWVNNRKAIDDYNNAVRLAPTDARAYYRRAEFHRKQRNLDKALYDMDKAISLDPEHGGMQGSVIGKFPMVSIYSDRASLHMALEHYDDAIADYSRALAITPGDEDLYKTRARVYQSFGYEERAQDDLKKAASIRASYWTTEREAEFEYQQILKKLHPDILQSSRRNKLAQFDNDPAQATEICTRKILSNSRNAHAYQLRGHAHRQSGSLKEAVEDYTSAISLQSKSDWIDARPLEPRLARAFTYFDRGDVHAELGQFDKAVSDFTEMLALKPADYPTGWALLLRGDAHHKLGDDNHAVEDYIAALRCQPDVAQKFAKYRWKELESCRAMHSYTR